MIGEKMKKNGEVSATPLSISERVEQLSRPIDEFFVIINVESLRDDRIINALTKSSVNKFGLIAVDEIHRVATKSSQQGANLLKLTSEFKIAATGTLLTNSPISCYVPLAWTENDHAILTNFKSQYCTFGGFNNSQVIGYKNLDLLKEELDSCSIRRTLADVRDDMPKKTVYTELVELSEEHRKFYDAIKEGVKEEADKIQLNSSNLLALTTRLRQATACPGILTTQDIMSSKIERCVELVEDLVEQGEKVVVMSNFKEPLYKLATLLEKYKPLVNTGDFPDETISRNVDQFQNDTNTKVFLGTHARVGTGLTLNAAAYLICLDTPFTYSSFAQSCDRIYRVNNTRPAFITVLVGKDTIDERVAEIIETKKDLSDYVVDNIDNSLSSLKDELLQIIKNL